jgi:hypothetical protein
MKKRPITVIVLAALLILTGAGGLYFDIRGFTSVQADHYAFVWMVLVHLLAIVAGAFLLRGANWARWLAIAWMAFHVAISIGQPLQKLIGHAVFLALFVYILFRADARAYFRSRSQAA